MIKRVLLLAGICFICVLASVLLISFSGVLPPVQMSAHGWFAFMLGAGLCILLSVGLFALAFFSARSGHDEISDLSENSNTQFHNRIG